MSLLNQVLQDLDDRDQPRAQKPMRLTAAPEAVAYVDDLDQPEGRDWVRIGTWSAVGIAMILAAWIFHDTDRGVPLTGAPMPTVSEVIVPVAETLSPAPIETVQPLPDSPAAIVDPVPELSPDAPAEIRDRLPEPVPVAQAGTRADDSVAKVQAQPLSSIGTGGDIANGKPAQTADAAEDHYLPLRNTELPMVTEGRPAQTRREASSSASVKTAKASAPQPLEQIRQAIEEGELASAEHLLEQRLRLAPKDLEARELMIGLMLRGERYAQCQTATRSGAFATSGSCHPGADKGADAGTGWRD